MIADQPPQSPPVAVQTVVVSAPSLPPSPADAAFSIVRLDPKVLATAPRLDEALEQIPGAALFRRLSSLGANPTIQGVSLRAIAGSAASRALVTLDGVPVNDPFGGWVIFTALPPESLGGLDVVRGAGAGPYGAGALTGVVSLQSAALRPGEWDGDARIGSLGWIRAAGAGAFEAGGTEAMVFADVERSDGWIPIRQGRGAADRSLTLQDEAVGARFRRVIGAARTELRLGVYQEDRGAGTDDAGSRSRGVDLALTAASPPADAAPGWRAQLWMRGSDLANSTASLTANRNKATPANNEFQTPALGLGFNAQLRKVWTQDTLEAGVDLRDFIGEDRENFSAVNGVLTKTRRAGGRMFLGGGYVEATEHLGSLLLAQGARLDVWRTSDAHDLESSIATGAPTVTLRPASRGGVTPTGRVGARYNLGEGWYVRAAAYAGFRPPTLNELYRPFRVGSTVTLANAGLTPERLYGVEGGVGADLGRFRWNATGFYNQLESPVTNVTLALGRLNDPVGGFIPTGGALLQRKNVGAVNAYGLEADVDYRPIEGLNARAAVALTHARMRGGALALALNGLAPAETPAMTVTAGLDWRIVRPLNLIGDLRYESRRFVDDQNRLPLAPATVVDLRLNWRVRPDLTVFLAAENLFDVAVEQNETANGIYSYGAPRIISIGVSLRSRPGG